MFKFLYKQKNEYYYKINFKNKEISKTKKIFTI